MADYVPPVGLVTFQLESGYSPPVGLVSFGLGGASNDRTLSIAAHTGGAHAAIRIRGTSRVAIAARTGGARAHAAVAYNLNLLSAVHAVTSDSWGDAPLKVSSATAMWREAPQRLGSTIARFDAADLRIGATVERWRQSPLLTGFGIDHWQEAVLRVSDTADTWRNAPRLTHSVADRWRDLERQTHVAAGVWVMTLPRLALSRRDSWQQATPQSNTLVDTFSDALLLVKGWIERWQQLGYPANARNPGPPIPVPQAGYVPPVGLVRFELRCPVPTPPVGLVTFRLDPTPCPAIPLVSIPILETYRVLNSCSLVRLPDRTPLPVASISAEVDVDSWCWSLTATVIGSAGWDLLAPQAPGFLPVEVEAMINGWAWKFLLDDPNLSRAFNRHSLSLTGRSRSAWLTEPFLRATSGVESNPRTAQQLAEQALDNLGWTLDWQLPAGWLVPSGLYSWSGTPIDQLSSLVKPVDGCLYTDPAASILTAYLRYPTAAWLWDGQTADIGIPEAAVVSLERAPDNKPSLNGCYVSGTIAGYTAWVKIAGTDGALVPVEPVVDPLLCHVDALRARGIAILSAAGPGHNLTAELLLTPEGGSGPGLLRPGLLAEIAGVRGMVRSVKVSAEWVEGEGLKVRQTVGIERREV